MSPADSADELLFSPEGLEKILEDEYRERVARRGVPGPAPAAAFSPWWPLRQAYAFVLYRPMRRLWAWAQREAPEAAARFRDEIRRTAGYDRPLDLAVLRFLDASYRCPQCGSCAWGDFEEPYFVLVEEDAGQTENGDWWSAGGWSWCYACKKPSWYEDSGP